MSETTEKKKKKFPRRLIIPLYLLIIVLLIVIVYALPTVTGALKQTMVVEYGDLKISEKATCYIIKNETLYFANGEGRLKYVFDEGALVRGGSEVLYIEPSEVDNDSDLGVFEDHARPFTSGSTLLNAKSGSLDKVLADLRQQYNENEDISFRTEIDRYISRLNDIKKSEGEEDSSEGELSELGVLPDTYLISKPGIISYSMDGYESEMSPYTMKLLDREKAEKIDAEVSDLSRETTRYGEPLFKIIDNSEWYAVMWIDERDLGKYSENKSVSMKLPDGDATGRVYSISESDGEIMVIMRFNAYYDSLSSLRKIQTEVISSDCSGLMIRNSFITSKDGQPGVYVLGVAGDSEFVPIKVKGTDGEYSIVESGSYYLYDEETGESQRYETVGVYDEIEKP
ncbi:MAG: HlyD family efflux transporter periplasmic adaptor subunit [Anaerovoracaceae bacterium]